MTMKIKLFIFIVLALSWSCSSKHSEDSESVQKSIGSNQINPVTESAKMDSISAPDYVATSDEKVKAEQTAVNETKTLNKKSFTPSQSIEKLSDTLYLRNVRLSKKFIKTADLRFKVKSVEKTTQAIENLTNKLGGYVQQSQIKSNIVSTRDIEKSQDSIMNVIEFYVDNTLTIKVPSVYFDSVLFEISKLYTYLDSRNVKTEDVSTTFLRNKLKGEKRSEYEKRIQRASDKGNKHLDDIVQAERTASDLADMAIDKKIENYELQDRIDFSTITFNMYQANSTKNEMVQNTTLGEYQPSFWLKAWNAIRVGWNMILEIVIGLLYLWPLYILAFVIYYVVKTIRVKYKK